MSRVSTEELISVLREYAESADQGHPSSHAMRIGAERLAALRAERDQAVTHHVEWCREHQQEVDNAHRLRLAAERERDRAVAALRRITSTYDAYRRRGVAPAPMEYADLVTAIDAARTAIGE